VIDLERHIEILLLWNDCVIVPGFGGFTASHVPAWFDEGDNMFIPPSRTLGFNPKLNVNDSLLAQSYTETYDISYPEALKRIAGQVDEIRQHIQNEGSYTLNDIGTLYLTESGSVGFTPCEAGVLTPSLYSLSSFETRKLADAATAGGRKEHGDAAQERSAAAVGADPAAQSDNAGIAAAAGGEPEERTISIRLSVLRNVAAALIAVVGFFALSAPVKNSKSAMQVSQMEYGFMSRLMPHSEKAANPAAAAKLNAAQPKAVAAADKTEAPEAEGRAEAAADKAESDYYCLVLASRVTHKNAELFAASLVEKGYKSARVLCEKNRAIKVVFGSFNTQSAAYNALNDLRSDDRFQDAWVYNVK